MNENIELGTFRDLIDSMDSYSKVIEMAIEVDENVDGGPSDDPEYQKSLFNLYGNAIKELSNMEQEVDEYESSIFIGLQEDEFTPESTQYVDVHLINDNYNEAIVVQPEMNFDDYNNYKTFAMDFMPWAQLLNKNVRVEQQVSDRVPPGVTLKEFVLGHIMWEITFYGFGPEQIAKEMSDLQRSSKESAVELEELMEVEDNFLDQA